MLTKLIKQDFIITLSEYNIKNCKECFTFKIIINIEGEARNIFVVI